MRKMIVFLFSVSFAAFQPVLSSEQNLSKAVSSLVQQLKPTYSQIYRDQAKEKLTQMGSKATPYLGKILIENEDNDSSLAILEVFQETKDSNATPFVLELLDQTDSADMTAQLVKTLGLLKSPSITQRLAQILQSAPENYFFEQDIYKVVVSALWALKETRDPKAVDAILEFAKLNPKPYYLNYCAKALGRMGDERALPYLVDWLKYEDRDVRLSAAESLLQFATPAMSKFVWAVIENEKEFEIKTALVNVMIKIAKEQDILKLISMLRSGQDYNAQRIADYGLRKLGQKAVSSIVAALGADPDTELAINSIRILSDTCSSDALELIIKLTENKNAVVQIAAIEALGKCADSTALDALNKLSFSFNKNIRKAARSSKEKILSRTEKIDPPNTP